jgi:Zn-dependent metalloprotease
MKKTFSAITGVLISALLLGSFPISASAQDYKNLTPKPIEERSDEYQQLKTTSLKYLNEELGREEGELPNTNFDVVSINRDELGFVHAKVRQTYNDIPLFNGEAIVHLDREGSLFTVTNDLALEVDEVRIDTEPRISADEAIAKTSETSNCRNCFTPRGFEPQLVIYNQKQDVQQEEDFGRVTPTLAYRIQLERSGDSLEFIGKETQRMPVYFIDAQTGEALFSYDDMQTQTVTNSGSSLYSGNVSFTAFRFGSPYYLENLTRKFGTFNGNVSTRFSDADGIWNSTVQRAGVDVQWGTQKTLEYYSSLGRNGIDNNGGPLSVAAVNGSTNLLPLVAHETSPLKFCPNNATWSNTANTAYFCDGDGSNFSPLVSIDVVAHELTHGVTKFTAGLVYSNESGALNESVSDIFGAMAERFAKGQSGNTWKIGEEVFTPGTPNDALRFMDNPHQASNKGFTADDDPDHYSERYTGTQDNGGVHINSGIPNKAFYLLAQGGSHHLGGSMTGIGADNAASIWYYALTNYMNSGTNFAGARTATINAATVLFGQTQADAVAKSWCLVGVGACSGVTYRAHVKDLGWLGWVSNGATAGTTGQSRRMEAAQIVVNGLPSGVGVTYRAHVAGNGWLGWVSNGATAGTTGQSRRMEAIEIKLTNAPSTCNINYRAHVAGNGWLGWVSNGATAGTTGQSRQMEALQVTVQCP